jgi:enterobactin synthetase component F
VLDLCNATHTHGDTPPLCRDIFIQKTPTNFDASVDELWTSLSAGATLVVAPPEAHRDVHSVMTLITRYAVHRQSCICTFMGPLVQTHRDSQAQLSCLQVALGTVQDG